MIGQAVLEMLNVMHNAEIAVATDELSPICFADLQNRGGVRQIVSLNDGVEILPPNSYRTLTKS